MLPVVMKLMKMYNRCIRGMFVIGQVRVSDVKNPLVWNTRLHFEGTVTWAVKDGAVAEYCVCSQG